MVENLSTRAVLSDKLSTAAVDIFNRLDHTVQNLGKTKPSENAPLNYKVLHKGGALVRSGHETTSSQVHQLAVGETVAVVELVGRRARIISPVEGWVSTETREGIEIMRPCQIQRKAVKNEAFEHMFEQKFNRLKHKTGGAARDPRVESSPSGSTNSSPRGPRDRDYRDRRDRQERSPDYSDKSDRDYRDRDYRDSDFRDRDQRDDRLSSSRASGVATDSRPVRTRMKNDASVDVAVPRLSAPGSKGGPVLLAPPPGAASSSAPRPEGSLGDDLLSMGDPQPYPARPIGVATAGASSDLFFDPFSASPAAPGPARAAPAAPAFDAFSPNVMVAAPAPPSPVNSRGGADWVGFQSAQPASMGRGPFAPAPQAPSLGAQMAPAGSVLNTLTGQGWGASGGQAPAQAPMGQTPSWGAQGQIAAQMMAMGQTPSWGAQGQMSAAQMMTLSQTPSWGAQGHNAMGPGAGLGGFPAGNGALGGGLFPQPAPPQQTAPAGASFAQFGGAGPNPAARPQAGGPETLPGGQAGGMPGMPGSTQAGGASVDDLMTQAMQGVSTLSFDQRIASSAATAPSTGVPMSMMRPGMS